MQRLMLLECVGVPDCKNCILQMEPRHCSFLLPQLLTLLLTLLGAFLSQMPTSLQRFNLLTLEASSQR